MKLNPREREVLTFAAAGRTSKEIAGTLGIAKITVDMMVAGILNKMGALNRNQAIAKAIANKLINMPDDVHAEYKSAKLQATRRGHRAWPLDKQRHRAWQRQGLHPLPGLNREGIVANTHVSDIALINLGFLLALKEAVVRDPVQACFQFRLKPGDAAVIAELGFDALESLALGLDESIVTLRYTGQDLRDLIKTPPALRNIFATVRELSSRR